MCGSGSVFRIRIRIQKAPEYGSNHNCFSFPNLNCFQFPLFYSNNCHFSHLQVIRLPYSKSSTFLLFTSCQISLFKKFHVSPIYKLSDFPIQKVPRFSYLKVASCLFLYVSVFSFYKIDSFSYLKGFQFSSSTLFQKLIVSSV